MILSAFCLYRTGNPKRIAIFCIRAMLFTERECIVRNEETECPKQVKHIYLRGAKSLRKDISGIYNIALDGPAGSGKSTIAKILAEDYHILYLDTGAMYRACALKALREGIDPKDDSGVEKMLSVLRLEVQYLDGKQHTFLDGEDVSEEIRKNEVSMAASDVSAHRSVREKMVEMQRKSQKICLAFSTGAISVRQFFPTQSSNFISLRTAKYALCVV